MMEVIEKIDYATKEPKRLFLKEGLQFFSNIHELFQARELLLTWTIREFRIRYSQSVLGLAWAILQPLLLMLISTVVFSVFLRVQPPQGVPYPVFVYTALLPWSFFANALTTAIPIIVANFNLVSKIYFPREILPLAMILVALADFVISAMVLVLLLIYYQMPVGPTVLILPLLIVIQLVLTIGLALVASALNVYYRDIRFVVPLILQTWLYLTPVFYPLETVPEKFRPLILLNPMATLIQSYRDIILYHQPPDWRFLAITTIISCLIFVFSYSYFKQAERQFADII